MRFPISMLLCLGAGTALADEAVPLPSIRAFDLATVEKLGRAIYDQDQEAWKASDILEAKYKLDDLRARKLAGWIVESFPDRDVVRFIHTTDTRPELFYDVTFPHNGLPSLSEPAERALSAEERAQYGARTLALKSAELKCSSTYNTVVLKDPEKPGWMVWVMAATSDPDMLVVGGHTRFTVSADGGTIVQKDKLSAGCGVFSRRQMAQGEFATTEVVSLLPVESYVFTSLSYGLVMRVETRDGKTWKVNADMITQTDVDMSGFDGVSARALLGLNEKCGARTVPATEDDKPGWNDIDGVIMATEKAGKYEVKLASGAKVSAVMCGRDEFVPMPNDYKVLLAGLPLYIKDRGQGRPSRLGVLEASGGRIVFRIVDGNPVDDTLAARIGKRLDAMQTAFQSTK